MNWMNIRTLGHSTVAVLFVISLSFLVCCFFLPLLSVAFQNIDTALYLTFLAPTKKNNNNSTEKQQHITNKLTIYKRKDYGKKNTLISLSFSWYLAMFRGIFFLPNKTKTNPGWFNSDEYPFTCFVTLKLSAKKFSPSLFFWFLVVFSSAFRVSLWKHEILTRKVRTFFN